MSAPPPQLPYAQTPYLGNYIPKSPRQPHLWQSLLGNFLGGLGGDFASNKLAGAMNPGVTTDATGNMTINDPQHFWQSKASLGQQTALGNANATNAEARARAAEAAALAHQTGELTPAMRDEILSRMGLNQAQAENITTLTPHEVQKMDAEQQESLKRAANLGFEGQEIHPNAVATRALQGAETGEAGARGQVATAEAGHLNAMTPIDVRAGEANIANTNANTANLGFGGVGLNLENIIKANSPILDAAKMGMQTPNSIIRSQSPGGGSTPQMSIDPSQDAAMHALISGAVPQMPGTPQAAPQAAAIPPASLRALLNAFQGAQGNMFTAGAGAPPASL